MKSEKSSIVAFGLCFFFGVLGAHRFYVGRIGTGLLQMLTMGGLLLWALYDLLAIMFGKFEDKSGQKLIWNEVKKPDAF